MWGTSSAWLPILGRTHFKLFFHPTVLATKQICAQSVNNQTEQRGTRKLAWCWWGLAYKAFNRPVWNSAGSGKQTLGNMRIQFHGTNGTQFHVCVLFQSKHFVNLWLLFQGSFHIFFFYLFNYMYGSFIHTDYNSVSLLAHQQRSNLLFWFSHKLFGTVTMLAQAQAAPPHHPPNHTHPFPGSWECNTLPTKSHFPFLSNFSHPPPLMGQPCPLKRGLGVTCLYDSLKMFP